MNAPDPLDAAVGGQSFEQVQAVRVSGRPGQVAVPTAALVFDFTPHVAVQEMLSADGERAAPLPAVAVAIGVGAQLAEQVDGIVGDRAVSEEFP